MQQHRCAYAPGAFPLRSRCQDGRGDTNHCEFYRTNSTFIHKNGLYFTAFWAVHVINHLQPVSSASLLVGTHCGTNAAKWGEGQTSNTLSPLLGLTKASKINKKAHTGKSEAGVRDLVYRSSSNIASASNVSIPTSVPTCSLIRDVLLCNRAQSRQENVGFEPNAGKMWLWDECYRSAVTLPIVWVTSGMHDWMVAQRGPAYGCVCSSTSP